MNPSNNPNPFGAFPRSLAPSLSRALDRLASPRLITKPDPTLAGIPRAPLRCARRRSLLSLSLLPMPLNFTLALRLRLSPCLRLSLSLRLRFGFSFSLCPFLSARLGWY